ncbi:hypothetical protein L228DRAFT_245568 [Xylona heveae TC161]|uniref:Pre-mRNA-splicing factor n=1 Tax=Xylona heveae (strain CBS 132557 / TC161) TaxID=1328760 RepID=A0A165I9V3_XYLHT|nr:hypothetical protein L228DRAFT_245568 [Xylona heveae TC161]KZF24598.1 hypothetical protein L228DRAFT_245568 [Xylona heveae TC161]
MPSSDPPSPASGKDSAAASSSTRSPGTFSLSLGAGKASKPSPLARKPLTTSGTKRPHSSLHDSDDEDDAAAGAQPQLVSSFDHSAGGAISIDGPAEKKAPLTIPTLKNRDWREESRRKRSKNLLPPEVQAAQQAGQASSSSSSANERDFDVVNSGPQAFGLNFVRREEVVIAPQGTSDLVEDGQAAESSSATVTATPTPKTMDELALEALTSDGTNKTGSNLVLPAVEEARTTGADRPALWEARNEDEAFRMDIESRPESASLDAYSAVPVEEFGAALLRGMGWKEGDAVGKRREQVTKPRVVERRPALLGIGAKEVPGGMEEFGAWGKAASGGGGPGKGRKQRAVDKIYNPVVLKNTKTGEMLTEDELKAKAEEQKRLIEEEDWKERRDRNLAADRDRKRDKERSRRSSRERERENDRDRDSRDSSTHRRYRDHRDSDRDSYKHESSSRSRHSSSRRDRDREYDDYSRSSESSSSRRRRRNDDYDDDDGRDYYKDDRKDRDKDRDRRRERDREDRRYDSTSSSSRRRDRDRDYRRD